MIVNNEIVSGWDSFGIFPCLENIHEELPLLDNTNYRKMVQVFKKMTFLEFTKQWHEKLKDENIEALLIYKIEFP